MPAAKKSDSSPRPGERVRVFVDSSMIDEPAEIIREDKGDLVVHLWPDTDERSVMSGVKWFPNVDEATAHGARGAWPDDEK